MEEIGDLLQEAREKLGLTLEEVERETRIRTHHLEALERGDWKALPSPVQARGFLHNYADFLGLDVDRVMTAYAEKLQSRRARSDSLSSASSRETSGRSGVSVPVRKPRWFSSDLLVAATVSFAVLVMLIWGGGQIMNALQAREGTERVSEEGLTPSVTPSATATAERSVAVTAGQPLATAQSSSTPTQPVLLGLAGEIELRLVAEMRAWLMVTVDGEEAYRGRMSPGEEQTFTAQERLELTTGNGAALHVFVNGQDQGRLGDVYQVITRVWTLAGAQTPTPTASPSPTITPLVTETPTATVTEIETEG